MPEPKLSQLLAAAAALVLQPPDARTLAVLAESCGTELDPAKARQDFYDVLCMPQSGRYIPPYAHVLAQGQLRKGGWWYFPAARFDGGDALMPWYDAVGFDPMQLDADPMVRGPHRPLDHVGFVLAYLSGLVASIERNDLDRAAAEPVATRFVAEQLGSWLDRICDLLAASGSAYLEAVAGAIRESADATRAAFPVSIPAAASGEHDPTLARRSGT